MGKKMLKCIVRNKEIVETKEELVRQRYIETLIEDYGYDKSDIKVEYGVKRSPSDNRKSLPVDIAVFENGKAKIFVETKSEEIETGLEQLKNYMDFDNDVRYGVWTNGNLDPNVIGIQYIEKVVENKTIQYVEKFNIPFKGYSKVEEQIKKKDLKPTNNLKYIFKQMRGFISANATGTTRDEKILNELMSILICKVYDERYKQDEDFVGFIVVNESEKETGKRIRDIFNNKVKIKYPEIFKKDEKISLQDDIITYVVGQLQMYSITKSSHQAISDAFESIIGYASKGSQGQFFTPKNVIELMVSILDPQEYRSILDPACGTAGFLITSMNHVWDKIDQKNLEDLAKFEEKKDYAMKYLYGIEKDDFLAKISKSYMAVLGDGKAGIFIENSLNEKKWGTGAKGAIKEGYFDYILTNPPFGKDVKLDNETKEMYDYDAVDLAFLERSLDLLKDGGILGIILPETIFHSPNNKKVRSDFFYKHNIKCLIDIPHDTFRPYNNAKCNVIFIEKNKEQESEVLAINIKNIGHNHLGETDYVYDINTNTFDLSKINDDTKLITKAIKNKRIMKIIKNNYKVLDDNQLKTLDEFEEIERMIKYIKFSDIKKEDVLVARNYFEEKLNTENKVSLNTLIDENIIKFFDGHGSPRGYLKGMGTYPYIRVKDIVNLEVYINPLDLIPDFEYERLYSEKKKLKEKDIVFVRRGSYRIGDVGILYKKDLNSIFTRELLILRVIDEKNKYHITAHNLLYLLDSEDVRKQLKNKIMLDTTLPNIADRWKKLYLPLYSKEIMGDINSKMKSNYERRAVYWEQLDNLKKDIKNKVKK